MRYPALDVGLLTRLALGGLNKNLKRSFWGIAYSSNGAILPNCTATQGDVTEDIINLAQLTPRIRTYGSDCNQTALVLQAIADSNADLTVWPTIFVTSPYNQTVVDRQWAAVKDAFQHYGTKNIGGLTVGNEFLLNSYGIDGGAKPTDPKGVAARTQLLQTIKTIKADLTALKLDDSIPVGTSDAGSAATEELMEGIDYFMANDHPWFGALAIDQAAGWTWDFLQGNDVVYAKRTKNKPMVYIGETGWPTESDDTEHATNGPSDASVANLQKFIDDFVCPANKNITANGAPTDAGYFFFEYQDMKWQEEYGGVEAHWGLFDFDKNFKSGLTIPDCAVDSPLGGTVDQLKTNAKSSSKTSGKSDTSSAPSPKLSAALTVLLLFLSGCHVAQL